MSESWNPGRAWGMAAIAAALLLLGWPRGPAAIAPLPECDLHLELRGDAAQPGLLCLETGVESRAALSAASGGCALPAHYQPRDGDRLTVSAAAGGCAFEQDRMSGAALLALGLPIDVNRASPADLEALPGIGPVLAGRIAEYARERPFSDLEELTAVRGIGPKKLGRIRPLVVAGPQ